MAAKDLYHDACVRALQNDGWTITDEPLTLKVGTTDLFVDVGAERMLAAEKNNARIAVEVKSFIKLSPIQDLKEAIGQFVLYENALAQSPHHADRILYLAVRTETFDTLFSDAVGKMILASKTIRLVVFNPEEEVIARWIP